MERIWAELKKIEAQGESIRSEAQKIASDITNLAQQEAAKLVENSKTYAEEDAERLYSATVQEENNNRDERLATNRETVSKLRAKAEKRLEQAASVIRSRVLGENEF